LAGLTPWVWRYTNYAMNLSGPKDPRVIYCAKQPTGAKGTPEFYASLKGVRCYWANSSAEPPSERQAVAEPPAAPARPQVVDVDVDAPAGTMTRAQAGGKWVRLCGGGKHLRPYGMPYMWMADSVKSIESSSPRDSRVLWAYHPPVESPHTHQYGAAVSCGVWGHELPLSVGPKWGGDMSMVGTTRARAPADAAETSPAIAMLPVETTPDSAAIPLRVQVESAWAEWGIGDRQTNAKYCSAHLTPDEIKHALDHKNAPQQLLAVWYLARARWLKTLGRSLQTQLVGAWAAQSIGDSIGTGNVAYAGELTPEETERALDGRTGSLATAYLQARDRWIARNISPHDDDAAARRALYVWRVWHTVRRALGYLRANAVLRRALTSKRARALEARTPAAETVRAACVACHGSKVRVRRINLGYASQEIRSRCPDCAPPAGTRARKPCAACGCGATLSVTLTKRAGAIGPTYAPCCTGAGRRALVVGAASARRAFGAWKSALRVAQHAAASSPDAKNRLSVALAKGSTVQREAIEAIRAGDLKMLKYMAGEPRIAFDDAGRALGLVGWLRLKTGFHLCDLAATGGHLETLVWLMENSTRASSSTCCAAAAGGHLETLQYLRECGVRWNAAVGRAAARGGHLETIKWMDAHGFVFDADATCGAATNGHLETLKWLCTHGCVVEQRAVRDAERAGHPLVAAWLKRFIGARPGAEPVAPKSQERSEASASLDRHSGAAAARTTPPTPPQDERARLTRARLEAHTADAELRSQRIAAKSRLEAIQQSAAERAAEMAARIAHISQEAELVTCQDRLESLKTEREMQHQAFRTKEAISAEVRHAAWLRESECVISEEIKYAEECAAKRAAITAELELERLQDQAQRRRAASD